MRFTGSKSKRLTHSFLSVTLLFAVYFVECESRAKPKREESGEADEEAEEDSSAPASESEDFNDVEASTEEDFSTNSKVSGADEKWSMDPVKADDFSDDFHLDPGYDNPAIGLDFQEASILRNLPSFLDKHSTMDISGVSAKALCKKLDSLKNHFLPAEKPKLYVVNIPVENPSPRILHDLNCITWRSKACKGQRLASAFDPHCIFWIPTGPSSSHSCDDYDYLPTVGTLYGNGIRLNGYDAYALCQSAYDILTYGTTTQIPLKTNEASKLRCFEFIQQNEFEWKVMPILSGCEEANKFRISSLHSKFQALPYIGRMGCVRLGNDINCDSETPISTVDFDFG